MTLLTTGPLSLRLEGGALRDIRWNGIEAIRGIAWLVRDRDWGTLPARIRNLRIDREDAGFRVHFGADADGLHTRMTIEGRADGFLRVEGRAVPPADLLTNRTGFTILHPITGVAGHWARITHSGGDSEETTFPDLIEPWQPFKDIAAIAHRIDGAEVCCEMAGGVFEMEDQRNWSDASFKTYVRPLALPWPYVLPAGQEMVQSVTLRFRPGPPLPPPRPVARRDAVMPRIGLVISPEELPDALAHAARLAEIGPQHILCHLDPTAGHGAEALAGFAQLQRACPAAYDLEYVVACTGSLPDEMQALARAVAASGLRLASLAVCPSVDRQSTPPGSAWPDCPPLAQVYAATRAAFPGLPLGGGMFSYFTELNRKRPPVELLDYVTHGTNPIVHAADDESVMQTLETIPHILRSARAIIGAGEYRLGLTSIGMRQNPYGSRTIPNPDGTRICMTDSDPRQSGDFAAAFTTGYAATLAGSGVTTWVPAAFTGPRGIVGADGTVWPVGRVIAALAKMAGKRVVATGEGWLKLEDGSSLEADLAAPYAVRLGPPPSRTQPK
ncbi:hypothetical protein RM190_09265 [Paracoccus sp. CPCC 101403]|uniref:Uncharacterized protein n=1 Tax=Paracoccus broussonetiae TaxID=3075834 RepID=A0ABU3ECS7_9RHOB|nr:hypothetical protein [Paracoccus sp. CPCC 101403]MDT1062044.1 hypothetical protein [Paracoccus sp. CPCC 101403]